MQLGAHQKAMIGSMKERKMQMRAMNNGVTPGRQGGEVNGIAGVGHGFAASSRPMSRDSRVRTANQMNRIAAQKHGLVGS
jgi:hypothetical protein